MQWIAICEAIYALYSVARFNGLLIDTTLKNYIHTELCVARGMNHDVQQWIYFVTSIALFLFDLCIYMYTYMENVSEDVKPVWNLYLALFHEVLGAYVTSSTYDTGLARNSLVHADKDTWCVQIFSKCVRVRRVPNVDLCDSSNEIQKLLMFMENPSWGERKPMWRDTIYSPNIRLDPFGFYRLSLCHPTGCFLTWREEALLKSLGIVLVGGNEFFSFRCSWHNAQLQGMGPGIRTKIKQQSN